jgi:hypothetical protein
MATMAISRNLLEQGGSIFPINRGKGAARGDLAAAEHWPHLGKMRYWVKGESAKTKTSDAARRRAVGLIPRRNGSWHWQDK